MTAKTAKLGDQVEAKVDSRINNGNDKAVAFVTSVSENEDGDQRVTLRVLMDTGADIRLTNVELLPASKADKVEDDEVKAKAEGTRRVAFWPSSK